MEINNDQQQASTQQSHITDFHDAINSITLKRYRQGVTTVRYALLFTGAILLIAQIAAIKMARLEFSIENFILIMPFVGSYIILAIFSNKKPYSTLVTGLLLFLAYWALQVGIALLYNDQPDILKVIFSGILAKILILAILGRPLSEAKKIQRAKEEGRVT